MNTEERIPQNMLAMVQNAPFGFWSWDLKTNKEWWSSGFYSLLQLEIETTDPSYELWLNDIVHPEDKEAVQKAVELHLSDNAPYNLQIRMKVGSEWKWFETTGQAERNTSGTPVTMTGTIHEIDQLVLTNFRLKEQNEILNEISGLGSIGSWKVDLLNNSVLWSEEIYKIHDADLDYVPSLSEGINFFTPEYREVVSEILEKAIRKKGMFQFEAKIQTEKGKIKWIKSIGKIVCDRNENATSVVGLFQDITNDMESRIEKENSFRIIEQQNNRLVNFAHIVSHNLRTHSGNMQMLHGIAKNVKGEAEIRELLEMLEKASIGLSETIDHLNEVVAIQTNKELPITSIHIKSQIESILSNLNAQILQDNATIELDVQPSHSILFNQAYFDSVVINLVSNALKFKSPNRNPNINISTRNEHGSLQLIVKDNGLGINLELYKDKLFGLYKTFHNSKDSKGIGLFITKNQLDSMGATISVESEVDKGTTFRIQFAQ